MDIPKGKEFKDLYYYQDESEPFRYYILSPQPTPEVTPAGRPTLNLMVLGTNGILQLGSRWAPSAQSIEELRHHLVSKTGASSVTISNLEVGNIRAELLLYTNNIATVLSQSNTSNISPYTALFHVSLKQADLAYVLSALHGQEDVLMVRYHADLTFPLRVAMKLSGSLHDFKDVLIENSVDLAGLDSDALVQWLDYAVKIRILQVESTNYEYDSPELFEQDYKTLLGRSAEWCLQSGVPSIVATEAAQIDIEVESTRQLSGEYAVVSDVSTWLNGFDRSAFIVGSGFSDSRQGEQAEEVDSTRT